jgi:hypothetical protein
MRFDAIWLLPAPGQRFVIRIDSVYRDVSSASARRVACGRSRPIRPDGPAHPYEETQ